MGATRTADLPRQRIKSAKSTCGTCLLGEGDIGTGRMEVEERNSQDDQLVHESDGCPQAQNAAKSDGNMVQNEAGDRDVDHAAERDVNQPTPSFVNYIEGQPVLVHKSYDGRLAKVLGAIELCCGVILFALQLTSGLLGAINFYDVPLWAGLFLVVAGAITVKAGARNKSCLIKSSFVLSVIAGVLVVIVLIRAIISVTALEQTASFDTDDHRLMLTFGLTWGLLLSSLIASIVAIWSSVLPFSQRCSRKYKDVYRIMNQKDYRYFDV